MTNINIKQAKGSHLSLTIACIPAATTSFGLCDGRAIQEEDYIRYFPTRLTYAVARDVFFLTQIVDIELVILCRKHTSIANVEEISLF